MTIAENQLASYVRWTRDRRGWRVVFRGRLLAPRFRYKAAAKEHLRQLEHGHTEPQWQE